MLGARPVAVATGELLKSRAGLVASLAPVASCGSNSELMTLFLWFYEGDPDAHGNFIFGNVFDVSISRL